MEIGGTLEIRTETHGGATLIHAEGVIGLTTAADLRTSLMQALECGSATVLDAAGVSAIDLCGLQLLCSAIRSWRVRGREFRVSPVPDVLTIAAKQADMDIKAVFGNKVTDG
jgi:anti-anti-sigma factor